MRIEGQQTLAAGRSIVWSLIHDPVVLRQLLPGCEALEPRAADEYWLEMAVRIGPNVEYLSGTLSIEQSAAAHRFGFTIDVGNAYGGVTSHGHVLLDERGPEQTTLTYEAEIETVGRPAAISARMLQTTARSYARRSLQALAEQVAIRTRVYTTTVNTPSPHAGGDADLPRRDLDRVVRRRRLLILVVLALAVVALWRRLDFRREAFFQISPSQPATGHSAPGTPPAARSGT